MFKHLGQSFVTFSVVTFSVFVISSTALALPSLICITGDFPTTSFFLDETQDNIELRVINHNGAKYAPVYSGIVTPSDIDHIKKSGEFFDKIGDFFTIKFAKKDCRIEEDKFYTCVLSAESEISGTKIKSVYFSTSESVDKIPDFEFTRKNVRLSLREHAEDILEYRLEMSYYGNDCAITPSKKK